MAFNTSLPVTSLFISVICTNDPSFFFSNITIIFSPNVIFPSISDVNISISTFFSSNIISSFASLKKSFGEAKTVGKKSTYCEVSTLIIVFFSARKISCKFKVIVPALGKCCKFSVMLFKFTDLANVSTNLNNP